MKETPKACCDCSAGFMAKRSFSIRCERCRYDRNLMITKLSHMVMKAMREGRIPDITKQACVDCGEKAAIYDHRDYSKPLEVVPVCVRCNKLRGPAKPPTPSATSATQTA